MNYERTSWRNAPGPGDFHPPEYYDDGSSEPDTETVWRFAGYRIVNDELCIVETAVEVDTKTRAVIEYGRKRNRAIASCYRAGPEQYARKHPRSGPKLVAWMDEHWGRACPGK